MRVRQLSLRTICGWIVFSLVLTGNSFGQDMAAPMYVDVDGVRTRYFVAGSGPNLVLIHGGSLGTEATSEGWSPVFTGLAKHFRVYAFDKLGHGGTDLPKSEADYTMNAWIKHAHGFIGNGQTMRCRPAAAGLHCRAWGRARLFGTSSKLSGKVGRN